MKLLLIAVLIGVVLTGCASPAAPGEGLSSGDAYADSPRLGVALIFPEGWTPVLAMRESGQYGDGYFVCVSESGEYRVCYPRIVR